MYRLLIIILHGRCRRAALTRHIGVIVRVWSGSKLPVRATTGRVPLGSWGEFVDNLARTASGESITYSGITARIRQRRDVFAAVIISHFDIVVEVTQHIVRVIGGNVGDTVSMHTSGSHDLQKHKLDQDGYLADGQKVIAGLKNRASEFA